MFLRRWILKALWNAILLCSVICITLLLLFIVRPFMSPQILTWEAIFEFEPSGEPGSNFCNRKLNISHQKVIAFSVYGAFAKRHPDYLHRAAKAVSAIKFYKDWRVRFYHDHVLQPEVLAKLKEDYDFVDLCDVRAIPQIGNLTDMHNMMWRFLAIGDPSVDVFVSRDIESPITRRDAAAVQDWLGTDKLLHVMRDHPAHDLPIAGGMWGYQNRLNRMMGVRFMNMFVHAGRETTLVGWKYDQTVLQRWLWPRLRHSVIAHDSFHCGFFEDDSRPWPVKRYEHGTFVGCESYRERPCDVIQECPMSCRPDKHKDWNYC